MNNKAILAAIKILDKASSVVVNEFLANENHPSSLLSNYRPWLFLYDAEKSLRAQLSPYDEFDGVFEARSYRP